MFQKKTRKHKPHRFVSRENNVKVQQEVSLKKIIVEGYRAVGSLNDSFQFKELYTLLIQLPYTKGSYSTSVSLITPGHTKTPKNAPRHPRTLRCSIICIFNVLYESVDDVFVLIYSINVMWLYLFACIFSILE